VNLILNVDFIEYAQLPRSFSGTSLIQSVSRSLVAVSPVRDLLLCANYLFVPATMASASCWEAPGGSTLRFDEITPRKSNDATVNPYGGSSDERVIADT
jgi:hypothetical protein